MIDTSATIEASPRKRWWFLQLLFWLIMVMIWISFCAVVLGVVMQADFVVFHVLLTTGLMMGFTRAIFVGLPYFRLRGKWQRVLISAGLALIPLLGTYAGGMIALEQILQDTSEARFTAPAHATNEIIFYDGGFLDRDFCLCAKSRGVKERFVASFSGDTEYSFDHALWTKDGEAVVCWLGGKKPGSGLAYDFGKREKIDLADEAGIQKFIASHGGTNGPRLDDDLIRKNESRLWFWQNPPSGY